MDVRVIKKEFYWVLVYFFYFYGRDKYKEIVEEVCFFGILVGLFFKMFLMNYLFLVRGKKFFDEVIVKKGKYYELEMLREKVEEIVCFYIMMVL